MTGIISAVVDAWTELRIHRGRVLLSLFGVMVAVAALTASVAMSTISQQVQTEAMERSSGRPATFQVQVWSTGATPLDNDKVEEAFADLVERYSVTYSSYNQYISMRIPTPMGVQDVQGQAVSVAYGEMHRVTVGAGRWFDASDVDRLAPAVVINDLLWQQLGSPQLSTHPTLTLPSGATGVIVGIVQGQQHGWGMPYAYVLYDTLDRVMTQQEASMGQLPMFEMWVNPDDAAAVEAILRRDLTQAFPDAEVMVQRSDYAAWDMGDPFGVVSAILYSIAGVILVLGALSLLNIALVTVRQRVREIGIRRAFGASASRVFFSVMLESVVGTVLAGVLGIMLAVLALRLPAMQEVLTLGMIDDTPPFPVAAAVVGLVASTVVGALAGLIPALVAVRVKPIDAIRF